MGAEYFLDKIRDFNKVRKIVISFSWALVRNAIAPPERQ